MKLGNFFDSAATCVPVNPKPITFRAIASGKTLPNGKTNPSGTTQAATISALLVFLSGDEIEDARVEARKALRARYAEKGEGDQPLNDDDYHLELTYHILWRAIREDDDKGGVGPSMFPSVDVFRRMVVLSEANRLLIAHNEYMKDEHPEVVDSATFRDAGSGGEASDR